MSTFADAPRTIVSDPSFGDDSSHVIVDSNLPSSARPSLVSEHVVAGTARTQCSACPCCLETCSDESCTVCAAKLKSYFKSPRGRLVGTSAPAPSPFYDSFFNFGECIAMQSDHKTIPPTSASSFPSRLPRSALCTPQDTPDVSDDESTTSSSSSSTSSYSTSSSPISPPSSSDFVLRCPPATTTAAPKPPSLTQDLEHRSRALAKSSFTLCEVKRHNKLDDCWIVAGPNVYDATTYLNDHPGGTNSILKFGGGRKDCLEDLMFHSANARVIWKRYKIGTLVKCEGLKNEGASITPWPNYKTAKDENGSCTLS